MDPPAGETAKGGAAGCPEVACGASLQTLAVRCAQCQGGCVGFGRNDGGCGVVMKRCGETAKVVNLLLPGRDDGCVDFGGDRERWMEKELLCGGEHLRPVYERMDGRLVQEVRKLDKDIASQDDCVVVGAGDQNCERLSN
jgi:hypothetical protein